jgi:hypothetical protein
VASFKEQSGCKRGAVFRAQTRAAASMRGALALVLALGCTATETPTAVQPAQPTQASSATAAPNECAKTQAALLNAIERSRERPCQASTDCATILGPRHHLDDYREVVHAQDAAALNQRASAQLERCGETIHHADIGVYRVVEARCIEARCAVSETNMHLEE